MIRALSSFSIVKARFLEQLALILVPSKANILKSKRLSLRQRLENCLNTFFKAEELDLQKLAIVEWSGFRLPVSQINSIFLEHSRSCFLED